MLVLGATTLLTVLGLSSMIIARLERNVAKDAGSGPQARLVAASGLELAVNTISAASSSRATVGSPFYSGGGPGGTTLTVTITDPDDGNLTDSETDSLSVDSTAAHRGLTFRTRATFDPEFVANPRLAYGVVAEGGMTFNSATVFSSAGLFSGGGVSTNSSTIVGQLRAVGTASGSGYTPAALNNQPALPAVDASVFSRWTSVATAISISSLSGKKLENVVLGPNLNPYGAGNAQGIYVIDCGGQEINVADMRLRGTLILINPDPTSEFNGFVTMEPNSPDAPVLLVSGSMIMDLKPGDFSESVENRNLNPPGAAYDGVTDSDKNDVYAPVLSGLVYVSGNLTLKQSSTFDGVLLVGGTLIVDKNLVVWHRAPLPTPLGFRTFSEWNLDAATLRRIVE